MYKRVNVLSVLQFWKFVLNQVVINNYNSSSNVFPFNKLETRMTASIYWLSCKNFVFPDYVINRK